MCAPRRHTACTRRPQASPVRPVPHSVFKDSPGVHRTLATGFPRTPRVSRLDSSIWGICFFTPLQQIIYCMSSSVSETCSMPDKVYVHRPHARLHTCQNVTFTAAVITNTSQAARSIRDTHQSVGCWLMARRVHESMSCTSSTIYIAEGTGLSKCTKENILPPTCMPLQDEVYASSGGGSSNRTK